MLTQENCFLSIIKRKCRSVIVFNESKREFAMTKRKWFIGSEQIDESEGYTHLGVFCDKFWLYQTSCLKAKGVFHETL